MTMILLTLCALVVQLMTKLDTVSAVEEFSTPESDFILVTHTEERDEGNLYCMHNFNTLLAKTASANEKLDARSLLQQKNVSEAWIGLMDIWHLMDGEEVDPFAKPTFEQITLSQFQQQFPNCKLLRANSSEFVSAMCSCDRSTLCNKPEPEFILVPVASLSWTEANDYCLDNYGTELATVRNAGQNLLIKEQMCAQNLDSIWIGFSDSAVEGNWQWEDGYDGFYYNKSVSGLTVLVHVPKYENWQPYQLPPNGNEDFAVLQSVDGKWVDSPNNRHVTGFVCNEPRLAVLPLAGKTRQEANTYCSTEYGTELATIQNAGHNTYVYNQMQALSINKAWIGATDAATEGQWLWADGSQLTYDKWERFCPDNEITNTDDCAVASVPNFGKWLDKDCTTTKAGFVCNTLYPPVFSRINQLRNI